ncbi:MAG TPA: hypothetical protein VFT22_35310 [Kofleriaceae bacterium]|nr:hypothetical protein [Kofleriaceae bacterium]
MKLPPQRSLRAVFLVATLVFVGVAAYLYALRFFSWAESDAAVTVLLAERVLEARSPVVDSWYYANGDVWLLAPQLLALLPVGILGIGPASLWVTVVVGFVLEWLVLVRVYAGLCGERWIAVFAAVLTLMVWSPANVMFVYIELSYGWATTVYLVLFWLVARLVERAPSRPWPWLAGAGLLVAVAVQNPTRALVFVLAPLLVACAWPWRGLALRRRIGVGAAVTAAWGLSYVVYAFVFPRIVQFSVPRGHNEFVVADLHGIADNLARLGRGLVLLCGSGGTVWAVPGLIVLIGAVALVTVEALASRALDSLRFLCVVVCAQLAMTCVPLIIGNLLVSSDSVRYLMPSLLAMFGLAAILAVRAISAARPGWLRWLAAGWLGAVPVAALVAAPSVRAPAPAKYVWPDLPELSKLADELVHRKLTHGFANVLSASVLNLYSHGDTLACPVYFRDVVMPQRWLADTSCYVAARLPERFYIVIDRGEHDERALRNTLPPGLERFRVGSAYEVVVFRTAEVPLPWLDLPLLDGADARFPMEIPATNLQMSLGEAVREPDAVVATGKPGTVMYGPYITLPKGSYELTWFGRGIDTPGRLAFSVRTSGGATKLDQVEVLASDLPRQPGELLHLSFRLKRPRDGLEFVVRSDEGARVELTRLVIRRK